MSTKSYAMETRDRLVEAGNFADADTDVDDIVQIIEDDEREINRLEAENAKMREALSLILSKATETSNEDAVCALNWIDETASHAISLAAEGGAK